MKDYIAQLIPDHTYHVYNRAVGKEKLFLKEDNFKYFLAQYQKFILPIANTFSYCLLPNHFHFLISCKEANEIEKLILSNSKKIRGLSEFQKMDSTRKEEVILKYISQQFSHLFNGYTQAFNKQQDRHGGLFSRPFKRVKVTDQSHLIKLVHYIHFNPVKAGLCKTPGEWTWSSFTSIINEENTFLKSAEVVDWFENKTNFHFIHSDPDLRAG